MPSRPPNCGRKRLRARAAGRWQRPERLPAGDHADALAGLFVVGDARKQPAQFGNCRWLAALLEDGADRSGLCLADGKHRWSMGAEISAGKLRNHPPSSTILRIDRLSLSTEGTSSS